MWDTHKSTSQNEGPRTMAVTRPLTPPEQDDDQPVLFSRGLNGGSSPGGREAPALSTPTRDGTTSSPRTPETCSSQTCPDGPKWPDTPESARTMRSYSTFPPLSPLPPMLWDESPLAPGRARAADGLTSAEGAHYIRQVGLYIEGVRTNALDLKKRFDEAKQLNEIQLEIIDDLRQQLAASQQREAELLRRVAKCPDTQIAESAATVPEAGEKPAAIVTEAEAPMATEPEIVKQQKKPSKWQFWGAFKDALDTFGEMLFEQ